MFVNSMRFFDRRRTTSLSGIPCYPSLGLWPVLCCSIAPEGATVPGTRECRIPAGPRCWPSHLHRPERSILLPQYSKPLGTNAGIDLIDHIPKKSFN